jgi:hypothetical protein
MWESIADITSSTNGASFPLVDWPVTRQDERYGSLQERAPEVIAESYIRIHYV